jgi:uncharacterized membrane protein YbhN (UPF0104 family)
MSGAALLLFAGPWLHLGGGLHELQVLSTQGMRWLPGQHVALMAAGVGTVALVVGLGQHVWRRTRREHDDVRASAHAWRHFAALARTPRRAGTLLLASAGTTFTLAIAFVVVVRAVTGGNAPSLAALVVVYLLSTATASALHVPAIAGPTELALTAALVASGVPGGPALVSVLLFRAVTFWAPVPAGVFAVRALRRHGSL